MRLFALFALLLLSACSSQRELADFTDDRGMCDHLRGEQAYDAERQAFLEQSLKETCAGTDKRLARLKDKYEDDPEVMAILSQYEDTVETP